MLNDLPGRAIPGKTCAAARMRTVER